ncbi:MAG: 50S ribosomal protein L11 methyltransferase [Thermodesulfobacteriota bacterium]
MEARFHLADSQAGRDLARRLRRAGAVQRWQQGGQVWALWPAGPAAEAALAELAAAVGGEPQVRRFRAARPGAAWTEPRPLEVAPNLALAPAWLGLTASRRLLVIDAGIAFGAGDHPSTWLNLGLIARLLAGKLGPAPAPGSWAADVGAGSGVLAMGLALVGGLRVLALDPAPASRRAVARNRALNPLAGERVYFVQADHQALAGPLGLIAANLPWGILGPAGPHLARCLAPGGRLVLSGFRAEAGGEVADFFAGLGLVVLARREELGWLALLMGANI